MLTKHNTSPASLLRGAVPAAAHDESFPRAVAGEDYDRYAQAMARHADEWLQVHLARLSGVAIEPHELRDRLRSAAVTELRRELHAHEERLLSDVFQRRSHTVIPQDQLEPEIPSFLLKPMALR